MKTPLQTGFSGRVPVPPEKRFLIIRKSRNHTGALLAVCLMMLIRPLEAGVVFTDDFNEGTEPDPAKWTEKEDEGCNVYIDAGALYVFFRGAGEMRSATVTSPGMALPGGWTAIELTGQWAFPTQGDGESIIRLHDPDDTDRYIQAAYVNRVESSPHKAWQGSQTGLADEYISLAELPVDLTDFTLTITEDGWLFETDGIAWICASDHMAGLNRVQIVLGGAEASAEDNLASFDNIRLTVRTQNTATDPAHRYAWGENIGWVNAAPTNAGQTVTVHFDGDGGWLSGYIWGENIGWVKIGADAGGPYANSNAEDWGVNLSAGGNLSGYAWGGNVGWIYFGHAYCDAAVHPVTGDFSGHAWGENIGWVKFSGSLPDYGVRTLAFDTQPQGTPNWWLDHHYVTEGYDAGEGVTAWRKYVMDTDPNIKGDVLRITAVSNAAGATDVMFEPASTRRYYTLTRRDVLTDGAWSNVAGHIAVKGMGGEQVMRDTNTAAKAFYRVKVIVSP